MSKLVLDELCPNKIMLAPMVGITHFAVRAAIAEFLPKDSRALWPTEMLNSRRLPHQKENQNPETNFSDKANGLCPQILGNEEAEIAASMIKLSEWGALAVDINMGCPVQKALKHNYGVALMGDPSYAADVTAMAVRNSILPVSVKLRAGLGNAKTAIERAGSEKVQKENAEKFLLDFVSGIFNAGAAWVTLHPRTADQKRKGDADWKLIRLLKKNFSKPIIGNGDVQTLQDVRVMQSETGCDRVMIGRALLAKPWLIADLSSEPDPFEQGALYGQFLKRVLDFSVEHYAEEAGLRRLRYLVVQSRPWVEYGNFLYGKVTGAKSYAELRVVLDSFFSKPQKIAAKTEFRG